MVEHPRFKDEKVTMVVKIIIVKCQILDYFVDEMIEGQKCIIHPHPSQKLSPMSAD